MPAPKVKFVLYLTFHILHLGLLIYIVFAKSGDLRSGMSPVISDYELLFWAWMILFIVAELKEFRAYDLEGPRTTR